MHAAPALCRRGCNRTTARGRRETVSPLLLGSMGAVREVVRHYEHAHSIRFAWAWDHLGVNPGAEEARSEVPPAVAQAVAAIVAAAAAAGVANAATTACRSRFDYRMRVTAPRGKRRKEGTNHIKT